MAIKKFENINIKKDIKKEKVKLTKEEKKLLKEKKKLKKKELKEIRKEDKKVLLTTKELLPFKDADDDDSIITKMGHIDIFQRASHIFDEVYIGVFNNIRKEPLLSVEERIDLLAQATDHLDNIKVISFDGLLADYMLKEDIQVIVRGLRSVTDYEYEQGQAQIIKAMHPELDTMFLTTSLEYAYLSSTTVKEVASFGGDISAFVPSCVGEKIQQRMKELHRI